jgi:outer membrane protein insertion porin family
MDRLLALLLVMLAALPAGAAHVRILGLTRITEARALELMQGRLTYVEARAPNPARADDAAFFLRRVLVRDGFSNAQVSWAIADGVIVLTVREGIRLSLGEIQVVGVEDETFRKIIVQAFYQPATKRASGFGADLPFLEEDLNAALESVTAEFQSRGYWEPAVAIVDRQVIAPTGKVNLVLEAHAGPLFVLGKPLITGDLAGNDAAVRELVDSYVGLVADTPSIDGARDAVEKFFQARGFARAVIEVGAERLGNTYTMVFQIDAGPQLRVGNLTFLGLDRTDPSRVGARFAGMQGTLFDSTKLNKPVSELLATGAFASIHTDQVVRADGSVDLVMAFKEGRARGISAYTGVGSFEGFILGATYFDRNYAGRLLNLNVGGEITARGLLGEVRLTNPWMFAGQTHGTARLFGITRDFDGYDKREAGISATLTWDINRRYQVALGAGTSYVNILPGGITREETGETIYSHNYLRVVQKFERRDNPLSPRKGFFVEMTGEVGAAVGTATTSYVSTEARASYYIPVGDADHVALSLRNGILLPSSSGNDLPIDLRFFQGGPDSVRSFPLRRMGDLSGSNDPLGGEAYWTGSAEFVRKLVGPLQAVVFSDVGTLSRTFDGYGLDNVEVALGTGLRLDLPIGPIRFEYGRNMTRDPNEPTGAFHFVIGVSF